MKIGFLGLLAIVFIVLKLCGVIAWSWWLVLLPLYAGLAIVIGLMVILASVAHIADSMKSSKKQRK